MASNQIIRLQTDDDFLDIRAFSKHPSENFELNFLSNDLYWVNYLQFIQNKHKQSQYNFTNIQEWILNMKNNYSMSFMFPSIENSAFRFIARDIFNYSLMPQSSTLLDFSSFIPYSLNLVGTQINNKINFSLPNYNYKTLRPKPINKQEYKVIRILDKYLNIFIDLKTPILKESQVALDILKIPFFWRDYHLTTRTRIVDNAHNNMDYDLNNFFLNLYNPSHEYLLSQREESRKLQYMHLPLQEIILPTRIDFMKFSNMLMFSNPGFYLPLTQRESKWSMVNPPDMTITISQDARETLHLISFNLPFVNNLDDFSNFVLSNESKISPLHIGTTSYQESNSKLAEFNNSTFKSTLLFTQNQNISYCIEHSLIKAFQFLSILDNPMDKLE